MVKIRSVESLRTDMKFYLNVAKYLELGYTEKNAVRQTEIDLTQCDKHKCNFKKRYGCAQCRYGES